MHFKRTTVAAFILLASLLHRIGFVRVKKTVLAVQKGKRIRFFEYDMVAVVQYQPAIYSANTKHCVYHLSTAVLSPAPFWR